MEEVPFSIILFPSSAPYLILTHHTEQILLPWAHFLGMCGHMIDSLQWDIRRMWHLACWVSLPTATAAWAMLWPGNWRLYNEEKGAEKSEPVSLARPWDLLCLNTDLHIYLHQRDTNFCLSMTGYLESDRIVTNIDRSQNIVLYRDNKQESRKGIFLFGRDRTSTALYTQANPPLGKDTQVMVFGTGRNLWAESLAL